MRSLAFAVLLATSCSRSDTDQASAPALAGLSSPATSADTAVAGPDKRGEIELLDANTFAISPSGDLWISDRDARLYVSRDWNQTWSEISIPSRKPDETGLSNDELDLIRFFDDKHALLAGSIGRGMKDSILRTEDGGATWAAVRLTRDAQDYASPGAVEVWRDVWIQDACAFADGSAWLVDSSGTLYASSDYGATWRVAGHPFHGDACPASVCFFSRNIGFVGALKNALRMTEDGGRTWRSLPTPADTLPNGHGPDRSERELEYGIERAAIPAWDPQPPGPDDAIEDLWVIGQLLLARQHDVLYRRPLDHESLWEAVEVDGRTIVEAERAGDDLVVLDEDSRAHRLSPSLERIGGSSTTISGWRPMIAAGPRGVALLTDRKGEVCVLDDGDVACSRLHPTASENVWPIASFDRTVDGTLYGTSISALYRSSDSGRTWERLLERDSLGSVHAATDGSFVIVNTEDGLRIWTSTSGALVPLGGNAALLERAHVVRHGRLWVACTFDSTEAGRWRLRQLHTIAVGPDFTARTFASANEGLTWQLVDRCEGAIVHASWISKTNVVSFCMSDGSILRGTLSPSDATRWPESFEQLSGPDRGRGAPVGPWLAFPEERVGLTGAREYHGGAHAQRSDDGGVSWTEIEHDTRESMSAFLLGDGTCVRTVGSFGGPCRIEVWSDGAFVEERRFESAAHDAQVDSTGSLLVRLKNAEVWELKSASASWVKLGSIGLPRR